MKMMLDKNHIWSIFSFQFKMGYKAAETTCNINTTFDRGMASKCTMQQWFKKLCVGHEDLPGEEPSGWPWDVDNHQLRTNTETNPLKTTQEGVKSAMLTIPWSLSIGGELER